MMIVNSKNYFSMLAHQNLNKTQDSEKNGSVSGASLDSSIKKSLAEYMTGKTENKSLANYLSEGNEKSDSYFSDKVSLSPEAVKILMESSPETLESLGYDLPEKQEDSDTENISS
jgi:hypothetical protein